MMVHGVPSEIREIGEARTWYETQHPGLDEESVAAIELQLKRLEQAPLLYAEVIPTVDRALLPRFLMVCFMSCT